MPRYSSCVGRSWLVFFYYSLLIIFTLVSSRVRHVWIALIILWFLPSVYICVQLYCCNTSSVTRVDEQRIGIPPIAAPHQPPYAGCAAQPSVAEIPEFVYEKTLDRVAGGGEETPCSVCLEAVKGGEMVRKLPVCGHIFHVECIDMWLRTHLTCPNCRSSVGPPEEVRTVGVDDPPPLPV